MHAVVRSYTGASDLIAAMSEKHDDVKAVLQSVSGFVGYYAVASGDQMTTITVCQTAAGTVESSQYAANWVKENLPSLQIGAPQISEGSVFLHF